MPIASPSAGDRILNTDLGAFYNLLKGVTGSGEAITLVYNAAGVIALIPSSDPAAGTELIQIKNSASTVQSALSSDGRFYPADGLVGTPGIAYELDKDTGLYRIGANASALVAGGAEKIRWDATGVSLDAGITYLNRVLNDQVGQYAWDWNGRVALENTVTGTGTVTTGSGIAAYTTISTGATSGGTAGVRADLTFAASLLGVNKVRLLKFTMIFGTIDANTTAAMYLTDESVTGSPSTTARHLGLRQAAGTIFFSTADNTTEQTTDITAFVTANAATIVDITFDGTTARCYIGGTLRATHATNVPGVSAAPPIFRGYITNSAASNKALYGVTTHAVFSV